MSDQLDKQKPFSKGYVLRLTTKYQRDAIDRSIRMTFDRIKEFEGDPEKSLEVFMTLSILHTQRRSLDDFIALNKEHFKG